jgi:signal transduction histidine kinase/ActR/RegA family two-component response regulator
MPSSDTTARLLATDWAKTPLGPMDRWPPSLRLAVDICLSSRFPMFVWWGSELINIYNDSYSPMLGLRHPRAFGRPARESWEDIWSVIGPQVDMVMNKGNATWNERVLLVMERKGYTEETYFTWSYSPIRDETGKVGGLFCACKEETDVIFAERERDLLLAQAQTERARLELIATGAPLPEVLSSIVRSVETQSTDGLICSILVLDDAGERLLHGAAPGLPDAYNEAIHGVAIGPAVGSCGTAAFQRRPVFVTDIASDPLWVDYRDLAAVHGLAACCSTPIMSSDDSVLGTVALYYRTPRAPSAHDNELIHSATHLAGIVLEKERVDRRLRQSLEAEQAARGEAERASRMKDEFLATLSHELRTPLNAILGWTRILRLKPGISADLIQGVDVIERNARAQATIIQDLLDMSAIISGKVRLNVQPMDVARLVESALDTAMPAAQAKQIRLEAMLEDGRGLIMVSGDAGRLQQVLWNVLSNAVKFTPREGRIVVALERADGHAQIRVTDSGQGISDDFLPYVFDRFRQADASTTRRHGGLGLGLAIVKQLVELHGGTVAVASEGLGRGATFTVALPLLAGTEEPVAEREASAALSAEPDPVTGLRVLVVDDDLDAREVVKRLLEERRSVVSTAGSAEEAMRLLREKRFDVLVSDIGMPDEDGLSLLGRVRALGAMAGGDLPAVALTAYARPEDREKAMRAGFQLHVAKPIDPAELFTLVAGAAKKI